MRDLGHHPYLSALAVRALVCDPPAGYVEVDGTLAFFDVSGFTPMTERLATVGRAGAEHINDVLNTVFTGLINAVFRFGGDVLEFGGDAMVVLYTGEQHPRRAALAADAINRFMARLGRVETPAGKVALGVSCGMASGTQAYYLLGRTRRALVVAGPVSTAMARLEGRAGSGEVQVDPQLSGALPASWTDVIDADGARLKLPVPKAGAPAVAAPTPDAAPGVDLTALLPVQFRNLTDVGRRPGELKQVAMAFIRLTGTDELLARDGVTGVHATLAAISDIVDMAAADLDVCWLETQAEADSVRWTLISGAPTATERDSERLLRVLRRIADESPLPLRIGCNLGVVFVGDMGHPDRCTYIVMGDATNLAARLMVKAEPGQIIAGEHLVGACAGRFHTTALEPFSVKGKQLPVQAYLVGAISDDAEHVDTTTEPDMVGRDRELAALLAAIEGGDVIEILGEAGVGKTRLWHEARRLLGSRRWFVTRAEPHESLAAYLPFRRLILHAVGIDHRANAADVGQALHEFVARSAPEIASWLPLIAEVVGAVVASTAEVEALDPAFRVERMQAAVADLLVAIARPSGVIVVEDAHWLDDGSRGLVDVVARVRPPPVAIVLTRRPGSAVGTSDATQIELTPIDDANAADLLLHELPPRLASDATLTRLKATAAGNPLYLIEMARAVATGSQSSDAFPETLERVMAARIDQLSNAGRQLIREASILGATFDRELAARVFDRPELIDAAIWIGTLGDLVSIADDQVRFRHDLVRVAAYEGLSVRRRKAIHSRAGDVIEQWGDDAPVEDPVATLAFHATGSGDATRIVRWNQAAADDSMAKGSMEAAERLLVDVIHAQRETRAPTASRVVTHRKLATAAERAGHPERALESLVRAQRMESRGGRPAIAVERARILEKLGRYRAALNVTSRALHACDDPITRGHLLLARATVRNFLSQWSECLALTEMILDDPGTAADKRVRAQAHLLAEMSGTHLGRADAQEHSERSEEILIELDDSIGLANLYLNRGVRAWQECRVAEAVSALQAASERYQRAGDVVGAALADNNLSEILTVQFRLEPADVLLTRARRVLEAADYPLGTFGTLSGLSRIASWRGDAELAMELQRDALAGFRSLGAINFVADSLIRTVEIQVIAGNPAAALTTVVEASASLAELGEIAVLPATLERLHGQALVLADRPAEARVHLETARALAEQDASPYELALAEIGLGRLDGDETLVESGMARLAALDVLAPPPGP